MMTIARMTMVELWRQRTPWGFLIVGGLLLLPLVVPAMHGLGPENLAAQGRGFMLGLLGFCQFVAALLTIAASAGLVSSDRGRGTLLLVITKPLSRWQVLLGKMLGGAGFMVGVWGSWGLIAATALSVKFGSSLFGPTLAAFLASSLSSVLLVAFCLFLSCLLPAGSAIGLGMLAWLSASSAPKIAGFLAQLDQPRYAQAFQALHWLLPTDVLSEAAKQLAEGFALTATTVGALAVIPAWWLAAALVFWRQDLAPNDG